MKLGDLGTSMVVYMLGMGSPLLDSLIVEGVKKGEIKVTASMIHAVKDPTSRQKLIEAICLRQAGA
jgi:hypothetical protein